jgi:hypothetical protein
MRTRTRHPRLTAIACRVYAHMIWLYPPAFRRAFGAELLVTFRNRVEDVLSDGGVREWMTFAADIVWDTIRTSCQLMVIDVPPHDSASLLGLRDGDAAQGGLHHATLTVDLMFAAAGLVLGFGGWYAYFVILPSYVS